MAFAWNSNIVRANSKAKFSSQKVKSKRTATLACARREIGNALHSLVVPGVLQSVTPITAPLMASASILWASVLTT